MDLSFVNSEWLMGSPSLSPYLPLALVGERRPREAPEEGGWRCLPPPRIGPRRPRPSAPQGSESKPGFLVLPPWAPSRELGGVPGITFLPLSFPPFLAESSIQETEICHFLLTLSWPCLTWPQWASGPLGKVEGEMGLEPGP